MAPGGNARNNGRGRPFPVTLLSVLFALLALVQAGMAIQNFTWDEFKPGKPMDPDLLPWSITLLCLGGAFLTTAFGLFRLRAWGRRGALLFGIFFLVVMLYALAEDAPLLALLFTPGVLMGAGVIYLVRPSAAAYFH